MDIEYQEKFDRYIGQLKRAVDSFSKGNIKTFVIEQPFNKLFMFGMTVGDSILIYTSDSPLSGEHYSEENLFPGWNSVPFSHSATLTLSITDNKVYVYNKSALWLDEVTIDGWEEKEACDIVIPESEMIHIKRTERSETTTQAIADICHREKDSVIIRCDGRGITFLCAMRLKKVSESGSSTIIYEATIFEPRKDDIFDFDEDLTTPPVLPVERMSISAVYNGKKCILTDKLLLRSIPSKPPVPFIDGEEYVEDINLRCFLPQIRNLYNSLEVLEPTDEDKKKYKKEAIRELLTRRKEQVKFPNMRDVNFFQTDNFILACMAKTTKLRSATDYYFDKKKSSFLESKSRIEYKKKLCAIKLTQGWEKFIASALCDILEKNNEVYGESSPRTKVLVDFNYHDKKASVKMTVQSVLTALANRATFSPSELADKVDKEGKIDLSKDKLTCEHIERLSYNGELLYCDSHAPVTQRVLALYRYCGHIKQTARALNISEHKCRKILITHDVIRSIHRNRFSDLFQQGANYKQIAEICNLSKSTVSGNMPYLQKMRMVDRSENALRIAKCRQNKKNKK